MSSTSNANQPILCIPGVFANIKEDRIRRVFGDLDLGEVTRVDIIVPKKPVDTDAKENKFNRVFIHLIWNDTPSSVACRKKLMEGKDVKIIYDEPWFWRVSAYRPPAPKPKIVPKQKKATIQIDYEPEVKYSGIIAPGLTTIIAPGLSSQNQINFEPKSPTCVPLGEMSRDEYEARLQISREKYEFEKEIGTYAYHKFSLDFPEKEDNKYTINYGNMPASQRKKKIIIDDTNSK